MSSGSGGGVGGRSSSRIIDLRSPDFLQICLAPRRRPGHNHHHHLSHREERKASFTKASWIKKDKCKVTLPKFKVSVLQQPVTGIVDKLKGAWSKVKLMVTAPNSATSVSKRSGSIRKKSAAAAARSTGSNSTTPATNLRQQQQRWQHEPEAAGLSFSPPSSYSQDAVADCIEFIKQQSAAA